MDLKDTYGIVHSNPTEYTFLSAVHRTFSKYTTYQDKKQSLENWNDLLYSVSPLWGEYKAGYQQEKLHKAHKFMEIKQHIVI